MNPYTSYITALERELETAKGIPVSGTTPVQESDSKVLIFSPHPDDECIIGLLALRLMRETGKQVVNIPVTFGSNPDRQAGRAAELDAACGYLGWAIHKEQEGYGAMTVEEVVRVLEHYDPEVILFPHDRDWNSRHISTHHLIMDALSRMPESFSCTVVETEFWGAMDDPNLMVEGDTTLVADLVAATSLHTEEVARNPYHLLLPAWMQDNVRRGGELVGGQGQAAPDFHFATLYRLRDWRNGSIRDRLETGTPIPAGADALKELF